MAGNKHALTRYRVLDACFSNWMRKYYAEDLIKKCNEALAERYPSGEIGISRRTFFDDLNDMDELVGGYGVEIRRLNDGRKKYYRYDKENFSLFAKGFTEEELQALKENVQTLQRFKGLPTFSWMDSLVSKLEDKITVKTSVDNILAYEENTGYSGIDWLKDCFDAIVNKQPVRIDYRNFEEKEFQWTIHPYYIKQYNNRWFLIGFNPEFNSLSHIPLDRIDEIEPIHIDYIPNTTTDFEKYFDNVIGVTVADAPVQKCSDPDNGIIRLQLIPNRELESLILSFGPDVEVLEPLSLRNQIQEKVKESFSHYFDVQAGRTSLPYLCTVETNKGK